MGCKRSKNMATRGMSTESESEEDSAPNDDDSSSLLSLLSKLARILLLGGF